MLIWFTNAYTFSYAHLFSVFWEKIFFFCTSKMAIKCVFLHLQSWYLVQTKANKILFILVFFQCHMTHGSKVMTIWLHQQISCRNAIFWIDNSHHWNLGSTGQFRIFRICRKNEWNLVLGFKNIIKIYVCLGN